MSGDTLARGGRSATFGPPRVSQDRWDMAFPPKKHIEKALKLSLPKLKKDKHGKSA